MGAGSTSAAAASTSRTPASRIARVPTVLDDSDTDMTNNSASSQPGSQATAPSSSTSAGSAAEAQKVYPRSLVSGMKPTIGAYTPHLDVIKKGRQYITEATVDYEESHGSPTSKTAGIKEHSAASSKARKPASRGKAAMAALAEKEAFSSDQQIHNMEDGLSAILEMQQQIEAERLALDGLAALVGMGARLPAKDLMASYEHLLRAEVKHQQTRRKQNLKVRPTPGGIDQELWDMRKKVWEVHHEQSPLPTSGASAGGDDDDEDEDMEIMVTADTGMQSLKCPLTTNFLQDPVTSSVCKHSFSKDAIVAMFQSRGRSQILCPVHGCNRPMTMEMLQSNKALARKVARQMAIQQELSQREDEEYTTVE